MERTAEEFVHRLPSGRWFVGDFVRTNSDGQQVFLVEPYRTRTAVKLAMDVIQTWRNAVRTYAHKASAKRAAQTMIERVLGEREDAPSMSVEECLDAIADVRDILWPDGDREASWSPDTAEAIGRRLAFLRPRGRK